MTTLGEPGLAGLVHQLAGDAREVASAEIEVHKARLGEKVTRYKGAAIYFAIAGVLALGAFIALLVGLIMTLATLVGPGWATLIVVGVVLAMSAVLGVLGKGRLAASPVATS